MSVRINWMEVCISQTLADTLLGDESEGEVGLFIIVRQLVHQSCEEHDLHHLVTSGLCGVVKMK